MPVVFRKEYLSDVFCKMLSVNEIFSGDKLFVSAVDRACTSIVNYMNENKISKEPDMVSCLLSSECIEYLMYIIPQMKSESGIANY